MSPQFAKLGADISTQQLKIKVGEIMPKSTTRTTYQLSLSDRQEPASTEVELSWIVICADELDNYRIDLRAYLPENQDQVSLATSVYSKQTKAIKKGRAIRTSHASAIEALAPSIKQWSQGRRQRSVYEELSKLSYLFYYLDELAEINGNNNASPTLPKLDKQFGAGFASWLRTQSNLTSVRLHAVYSAVAARVSAAAELRTWAPSPFDSVSRVDTNREGYTEAQYFALIRMTNDVIKKFKEQRKRSLRGLRHLARVDPLQQTQTSKAATKDRWMYRVRNAAGNLKLSLEQLQRPSLNFAWTDLSFIPTAELVSAEFLSVLLRSGANEQVILDFPPGPGLKPGPWLHCNPFNQEYRTAMGWKNRSGKKNLPKRVPLSFRLKPELYPIRVLRYQELLGAWCRRTIAKATTNADVDEKSKVAALQASRSLWIYWNEGGWKALDGKNIARLANRLILQQSEAWPDLLDLNGEPIRYSARNTRDAYLQFVLHKTGFATTVAQQELTHSEDSASIQSYLRRTWVKSYAHEAVRRFHSAANSILESDSATISPQSIRDYLSGEGEKPSQTVLATKVRHGLWCKDLASPPPHVYTKKNESGHCPAEGCHDCNSAVCFRSSLPELAKDIENLQYQRDTSSLQVWEASSLNVRLQKLEELFSRFEADDQRAAIEASRRLDVPLLTYRPQI